MLSFIGVVSLNMIGRRAILLWGPPGSNCYLAGGGGVVGGGQSVQITTFYLNLVLTNSLRMRTRGMAFQSKAISLGRTFRGVRTSSGCGVTCGSSRLGISHGISLGRGRARMLRVLTAVLGSANCACGGGNGCVIVIPIRRGPTSGIGGMGKIIGSTDNRTVVKTGMLMGNATANIVASVGKDFRLRIPNGTMLRVACVKCMRRSITMGGQSRLTILLGRSAGALSRIIIMNCNAVGGGSLANTMTSIGVSSAPLDAVSAIDRTLTKGTTNLRMGAVDTRPNNNAAFQVHKTTSAKTNGSPLVVISKFPMDGTNGIDINCGDSGNAASGVLTSVGPGSVRSVRMLGSTDSATVCNTHTNDNIVVVAAGQKGRNGPGIACSKSTAIRAVTAGCRVLSTRSFVVRSGH